jgi:small-conductance mechanosensitive channel
MLYSLRELIPCAISGAYLISSKVIQPGDQISVKDFKGKVKEINILTTTIIRGNKLIIVPNSIITQSIIHKG